MSVTLCPKIPECFVPAKKFDDFFDADTARNIKEMEKITSGPIEKIQPTHAEQTSSQIRRRRNRRKFLHLK